MKLIRASVKHFGSYNELDFNFNSSGLTVIKGPTGSGKSTIQDVIPWILFGKTTKNTPVNHIRSWSSGSNSTTGLLEVTMGALQIKIFRVRGESQTNDLYWTVNDSEKVRGKDLTDTQRLLEKFLNITQGTFLLSYCYNEFSISKRFFYLKPKEQREMFEDIAPLQLPARLLKNAQDTKKITKQKLQSVENEFNKYTNNLNNTLELLETLHKKSKVWEDAKEKSIEALKEKKKNFDKDKALKIDQIKQKIYKFEQEKVKNLAGLVDSIDFLDQKIIPDSEYENAIRNLNFNNDQCPTCGRYDLSEEDPELQSIVNARQENKRNVEKMTSYKNQHIQEYNKKSPYTKDLEFATLEINKYQEQIRTLKGTENPFRDSIEELLISTLSCKQTVAALKKEQDTLVYKNSALEQIQDISASLRASLLKSTIEYIKNNVNNTLSKHFDSEFSLSFVLNDNEEVDTIINKQNYLCSYAQLSKGQRCLLSLALAIAVMKASANNSSVESNVLFFDEALDGMDNDLKSRSYDLFVRLANDSVFVIEHSQEFQEMFSKKIHVMETSGKSHLSYE